MRRGASVVWCVNIESQKLSSIDSNNVTTEASFYIRGLVGQSNKTDILEPLQATKKT